MTDDLAAQARASHGLHESRSAAIKSDFVIATEGNRQWAVVSLQGAHRDEGVPCVIYGALESREAAELARLEAIGQAVDHGSPYGPSEVPLDHFNALGRILAVLRQEGIKGDLHALAVLIADAATGETSTEADDTDAPPF